MSKTNLIFCRSFFFLFILLALAAFPEQLKAVDIKDLFLRLPPEQVEGLSTAFRQELLEQTGTGNSGYSSPSPEGYWLEYHGPESLTLFAIHHSPVVFKTFPGTKGFQLLTICRSRQTSGPPTQSMETRMGRNYDLTLFQVGAKGDLVTVSLETFLPPIGVWDFITRDTLEDSRAIRDLEIINQTFTECLTCHASTEDSQALDILTVTSLNGHSCAGFLAQFKLLPLSWNGEFFTKPHDRAAAPDDRLRNKDKPRGLYYREPGL
jgi:hypothetical protein